MEYSIVYDVIAKSNRAKSMNLNRTKHMAWLLEHREIQEHNSEIIADNLDRCIERRLMSVLNHGLVVPYARVFP